MVKVEGLSQKEKNEREKNSKLVKFVKSSLPEGFESPKGEWVYDQRSTSKSFFEKMVGTKSYKPAIHISQHHSLGLRIKVMGPEYLGLAEQIAERMEQIGLSNFYETTETQMTLKKDYLD